MAYTFTDDDLCISSYVFGVDAKTYTGVANYYQRQGNQYVKVATDSFAANDFDGYIRLAHVSLDSGYYYAPYPANVLSDGQKITNWVYLEAVRYNIASGANTLAQAQALFGDDYVAPILPSNFVGLPNTLPGTIEAGAEFTVGGYIDAMEFLTKAYSGLDDVALMATLPNGNKMPWSVPAGSTLHQTALTQWKADTTISVTVIDPNTYAVYEDNTMVVNTIQNGASGAGSSGAAHKIAGTAGNDFLSATASNDAITAGAGRDTVNYSGKYSDYIVTNDTVATIAAKTGITGGVDTLDSVELVKFSNGTLRLDTDVWETAGEAYRLYQATFDRTPDAAGLKYWINDMDKGASHLDVAHNFTLSTEFKGLYGSNPTDEALITAFYTNVLGRAPDAAGFNYWLGEVQNKGMTAAELLINFSESAENVALVAPVIDNGIFLAGV